ncbi:MAG: hypothetical protein F2813_01495 [Actinobacteria bacterium]|uniref:Unannotated protein n=1 Tax=freshwater metagenome TaxID=449393 RepID=A0A6J5ZDB0_9ZZZZ|nr:hypothetical protein [Actinomycetota bacterium]
MGKRGRSRTESGELDLGSGSEPQYMKGPLGIKRRKRTPFSQRERLGHETPGSVLRGPAITVTCECGEVVELRYGDRWTCPSCDRVYDTERIPRDQYEKLRKTQFRFRMLPIILGVVSISLAIFFTLTGNIFAVFILLPSVIVMWFMILRRPHRRAFQKAISDLPTWDLRAESK